MNINWLKCLQMENCIILLQVFGSFSRKAPHQAANKSEQKTVTAKKNRFNFLDYSS